MKEFKNFSKIAKIQLITIFVIFILILGVCCFGNLTPALNGTIIYSSFLAIILAFAYILEKDEERNKKNEK